MSAGKDAKQRNSAGTPASAKQPDSPSIQNLPPLKSRPKLAVLLGIILALWLAALVVMRLTTIRPSASSPANSGAATQISP